MRDEQEPKLVSKEKAYPEETYAISVMADAVGVDAVADAYFNGNIERLRAAVDKAQPGRFDAWCDAVKRRNFEAANTLFGKSMINRMRENPFGP